MLDKLVKDESEEMKWTCLLLNFYPILENIFTLLAAFIFTGLHVLGFNGRNVGYKL